MKILLLITVILGSLFYGFQMISHHPKSNSEQFQYYTAQEQYYDSLALSTTDYAINKGTFQNGDSLVKQQSSLFALENNSRDSADKYMALMVNDLNLKK